MTRKTYNKDTPPGRRETVSGQVIWEQIVVRHSSVWRPPTDVYELEGQLIVLIEIAGMRDGDFHIVLQDQHLIVSGVRRQMAEPDSVAYYQMEIPRGEFRTEVHIPWNIQRDRVTAIYRDGLLRIELPQARVQQVHIINVSTEEEV